MTLVLETPATERAAGSVPLALSYRGVTTKSHSVGYTWIMWMRLVYLLSLASFGPCWLDGCLDRPNPPSPQSDEAAKTDTAAWPDVVIEPARASREGAFVVCDEPIHDFGTIWIGPILEHESSLRNVGTEPAWVKVVLSCICSIRTEPFWIDPGEEVGLSFRLDTDKLRGKFIKGYSVRLSRPPDDQTCDVCLNAYDSEAHLTECGPACPKRSLPAWVRVK